MLASLPTILLNVMPVWTKWKYSQRPLEAQHSPSKVGRTPHTTKPRAPQNWASIHQSLLEGRQCTQGSGNVPWSFTAPLPAPKSQGCPQLPKKNLVDLRATQQTRTPPSEKATRALHRFRSLPMMFVIGKERGYM